MCVLVDVGNFLCRGMVCFGRHRKNPEYYLIVFDVETSQVCINILRGFCLMLTDNEMCLSAFCKVANTCC